MGASLLAFGRMILVLGAIIGALLLLARIAKKHQIGGGGRLGGLPLGQIEVLSRRSLGQHLALLVIRVAGRTFLVGQSSQQMTLLAEFGEEEWSREGSNTSATDRSAEVKYEVLTPRTALGTGRSYPGAWDALIDRLREMTVRH